MNNKKLSAPGRRGSNRPRTAFKADADTSDTITEIKDTSNSDKEKEKAAAEAKARAQDEAAKEKARHQRLKEEEEARARAEELAEHEKAEQAAREKAEKKRLKEEARRLAEEEEERAEQAAYEAKVARDKAERQKLREEAQQKAEEEELRAERAAEEERKREKEEARARAEELAEHEKAEQAAREKAEKKRLKEEARRLAEEEAEREEQAAFEAKVARDKAERKRLREEALKKAEEEEARRLAEEQETIRAAELAAKEELEREKREQEEAEAAEREKLRQQAEEEAAVERARAQAAAQEEEARLAKVREKAAAERKKRNAFLDDMDNFSSSFEQSQSEKEAERQRAEEESEQLLSGSIAAASSTYVSATSHERSEKQRLAAEEEEAERARRHNEKVLAYERQAALEAQREVEKAAALKRQQDQEEIALIPNEAPPEDFNDLTASLFASKVNVKEEQTRAPIATKSDLFGDFGDDDVSSSTKKDPFGDGFTGAKKEVDEGDDILSMPKINRVMTVKRGGEKTKTKSEEVTSSVTTTSNDVSTLHKETGRDQTQQQPAVSPDRLVNSGVLGNFSDDEEDDCGEDLTKAERLEWKAKQEDLSNKRKDFHGAVTYAFGGCFSWQMYSAVDAVDEHGKSYTEYLMRLQWGTNWENMQPWLVARRYREFDTLNDLLMQNYPNVKNKMHPLPKKQFFGSLDPNTVEQRTRDIEAYVCTIVTNLPSMLKSRYIDGFFSVQERITQIRKQIEDEKRKEQAAGIDNTNASNLFDGVVPLAPGTIEELGTSKEESAPVIKPKVGKLTVRDLMTMDEVEAMCGDSVRGFDDDELGQAEEKIRDFRTRLTKTSTKYLTKDAKVRALLDDCQASWPRLHVTCRIGDNVVDSMLIARAMQAEEDLEGALRELRSFLAAQDMGSPLHC